MTAQEGAVCDAAVQSQHVIGFLAPPARWSGHLKEAEVVCSSRSPWYVKEKDTFRGHCMRHLVFKGTFMSHTEPTD